MDMLQLSNEEIFQAITKGHVVLGNPLSESVGEAALAHAASLINLVEDRQNGDRAIVHGICHKSPKLEEGQFLVKRLMLLHRQLPSNRRVVFSMK